MTTTALPHDFFTPDEASAIAEHTARSYGVVYGLRLFDAVRAIAREIAACHARGDHRGFLALYRRYATMMLPPPAEDPVLARAVRKVELVSEALAFEGFEVEDLDDDAVERFHRITDELQTLLASAGP